MLIKVRLVCIRITAAMLDFGPRVVCATVIFKLPKLELGKVASTMMKPVSRFVDGY